MHIGFFSSIMGTSGGGPAIVDKLLLESIVRHDRKNTYTVYGLSDQTFDNCEVHQDNITRQMIHPSGKWLGIAFGLTWELKRRPVDLLHATFIAPPIVPCRYIFSVTCWSQFSEPEVYPPLVRMRLIYLFTRGIKNATALFVYTHYLKEKLIEKFHIDPERIFVIEAAVGEGIRELGRDVYAGFLQKLNIHDPYILFVGTLTKRKNVHRLVKAYKLLRETTDIRHKLVLVGEQGHYVQEILDVIQESNLADDIILAGRVQHEDLSYLYSGADLLVFPTISEGFGLPPVEAMACGTPVVASNLTCVPEVVGDAAYMIDPYNIEEMASAMHKCLIDSELRTDMIRKGKERAKLYSCDNVGRKTVEAYEIIHNSSW